MATLESRRWEFMRELSEAVDSGRSLAEVLNESCLSVCHWFGYERAAVFLLDAAKQQLVIHGAYGLSTKYVESVNRWQVVILGQGPLGSGPTTQAFFSGRPVIVSDIDQDPRFAPWREIAHQEGYRAVASFPLITRNRALGVLNCYSSTVKTPSQSDIQVLVAVSRFLAMAIDLAQTQDILRAKLQLLQRTNSVHDTLSAIALKDEGPAVIADTLAELTNGGVAVLDECGAWRVQSRGFATLGPLDTVREQIWKRIHARWSSRSGESYTIPLQGLPGESKTAVICPIVANEESLGNLVLVKPERDLDILDIRATERAAGIFALEFIKEQKALEADLRVGGYFLEELLSSDGTDLPYLQRRAWQLRLPTEGTFQVFAIALHTDDNDGTPPDPEVNHRAVTLLKATLAARHEPFILAEKRDCLVVIAFHRSTSPQDGHIGDQGRELARQMLRALSDMRGAARVHVAGGEPVSGLDQIRTSFTQARQTLRVMERLLPGNGILFADELGIFRLLMDARAPEDLVEFTRRRLGPILHADQERGRALLETLDAYLANNAQVDQAARSLFLHPNTVRYRLQRICDLARVDLRNLHDLLEFQLALTVWRLMGDAALVDRPPHSFIN